MPGRDRSGGSGDKPIGAREFAALMKPLGPFGADTPIAVAVSGGPDSLALAILTHRWLEASRGRRGGARFFALTVDHGLRPESGGEAKKVGLWLGQRGVEHHILKWRGDKPRSGIPAAAREARYRLLGDWCQRHGVRYLLLAHHLEDQAETVMLRLARGSGVDGLAAMAPIVDGPVRLLRPLLGVPKQRLRATLRASGQEWIEDPSNHDRSFARIRMRQALSALAAEGLTSVRLAGTAGRMMRARRALEAATGDLIAGCALIHDTGYAQFDTRPFAEAPEEIGLRALADMVMAVAGASYRPRLERLERLYAAIREGNLGRGRTLAGCVIQPCPRRLARGPGEVLVCREPSAVAAPLVLKPGTHGLWDGRYIVRLGCLSKRGSGLSGEVAALGREGWLEIRAERGPAPGRDLPAAVRATLPALWSGGRIIAVPHLEFVRRGSERRFGRFETEFAGLRR